MTSSAQKKSTVKNARALSPTVHRLQKYPGNYKGRGIIIPLKNADDLPGAWIVIKILRHLYCHLPIQIWHAEECDLLKTVKPLLKAEEIEWVEAVRFQTSRQNNEQLAMLSILHSPFRDVLLLNPNCIAVKNPEYLFDSPEFEQYGMVLWPGKTVASTALANANRSNTPHNTEIGIDDGQLMINKEKCWPALSVCTPDETGSEIPNNQSILNPDRLQLTMTRQNMPYAMPTTPSLSIGKALCHHDFQGNRIFQHRNFDRWHMNGNNPFIPGFYREGECRMFLNELEVLIQPELDKKRFRSAGKSSLVRAGVECLTKTLFNYHRVGHDWRPLSFMGNGVIGVGNARCETIWNLREVRGKLVLSIFSDDVLTCQLKEAGNGIWKGDWVVFEKMAVELHPVTTH